MYKYSWSVIFSSTEKETYTWNEETICTNKKHVQKKLNVVHKRDNFQVGPNSE